MVPLSFSYTLHSIKQNADKLNSDKEKHNFDKKSECDISVKSNISIVYNIDTIKFIYKHENSNRYFQ